MQRRPLLILAVTLILSLGAAPAFADDETPEDPDTTTPTTVVEEEQSSFDALFESLFGEIEIDADLGYGKRYKLYLYAAVRGVSPQELLDGVTTDENGEYDFGWGELKQAAGDLEGFPRNFGQAVSESRRHHGRDAHQPDHAANPNKPEKPERGKKGGGSGDDDA
jgi:hypothetical protein